MGCLLGCAGCLQLPLNRGKSKALNESDLIPLWSPALNIAICHSLGAQRRNCPGHRRWSWWIYRSPAGLRRRSKSAHVVFRRLSPCFSFTPYSVKTSIALNIWVGPCSISFAHKFTLKHTHACTPCPPRHRNQRKSWGIRQSRYLEPSCETRSRYRHCL